MAQSCDPRWLIILWCFVTLKAAAALSGASADGINLQMTAMIADPENPDKKTGPFLSTGDMDNIEDTLDNAQKHLDRANVIFKALGDSLINRRGNLSAPIPVVPYLTDSEIDDLRVSVKP